MPDNIYESDRLVGEYLLFHYGSAREILPYPFGPADALGFAVRCVTELLDPASLPADARALDVGCAVGRSTFDLARHCREVIGLDRSRTFVAAATKVRNDGLLHYTFPVEGDRAAAAVARRPEGVDPDRVRFAAGDAMDLPEDMGRFDVLLAANLLCRLPDPRKFIARLPSLVKPGGQLLLATPFTWLEEFTPRENWIGGRDDAASADKLSDLLQPDFRLAHLVEMPFLIREHARKFQWSVALGARWVKK